MNPALRSPIAAFSTTTTSPYPDPAVPDRTRRNVAPLNPSRASISQDDYTTWDPLESSHSVAVGSYSLPAYDDPTLHGFESPRKDRALRRGSYSSSIRPERVRRKDSLGVFQESDYDRVYERHDVQGSDYKGQHVNNHDSDSQQDDEDDLDVFGTDETRLSGEADDELSSTVERDPAFESRSIRKSRFERLTVQELSWMAVSLVCVMGLTVGAIVVTIVG
ncbi:uncharacterized protein JCM15063_001001 [Sporobolomyces koalae]|uniref:uncharacterized protein n=1 Tax=Sporobolomyces koalae TaxID=500713 RepID=UPI003181C4D7